MRVIVVWVLLALAAAALGAELVAWSGALQRWLLRRAVLALPASMRERYREEWLAELQEVPDGPITRAVWVISLYSRRRAVATALGVNVRGLALKRALDVLTSGLALTLLAPLMLLIAVAVRLELRGPALFHTLRTASSGRRIVLLKFRTWDQESQRPSRVGTFLRRTALDELPQLVNVLKGDLSLVGPRPGLPVKGEEGPFTEVNVKPGLTGPWILGRSPRESADFERRYPHLRSTRLDLLIMLRTVFDVLRSHR